jgi:hypothetical protein
MSRSYTSSPPCAFMACSETAVIVTLSSTALYVFLRPCSHIQGVSGGIVNILEGCIIDYSE